MTSTFNLSGKKVLIACVPADGHFNPLTGLAMHLRELGAEVRWYTSVIFSKKLEQLGIPHYPFKKAQDINMENLDRVFPNRKDIADPIKKINFDLIEVFGKRGEEYYADLQEIYPEFPFDLVVVDCGFSAIPFLKHKMKIPVLAIGIIPLMASSVDLAPYGMAMLPPANAEEKALYAQMREQAVNFMLKESIDVFNDALTRHGVPIGGLMLDTLVRDADLLLQIGSPGFEYKRSDIGKNVRFIGGLYSYASNKPRTKWFDERLNTYKKVILVTQGTVEKDLSKLVEPTLEAYKNTDTLVIVTTGYNGTAELRARYKADNIIIEDYIPFAEVMPHADVYVTNGGYGGTLLSIQHNLPMVAAGVHEGKNEICTRIGYFKLGVNLGTETPTVQQIWEGVESVLNNTSFVQNIERVAKEINSYDAQTLCVQHIQELLN